MDDSATHATETSDTTEAGNTTASLVEFPQSESGAIASILPDTPWTTAAVQACERRIARAWLDDPDAPQCVAVMTPADPDDGVPATAYLFGADTPCDALVAWVGEQPRPLDVICDDDVGLHVYAAFPNAEIAEIASLWFEHLDSVERPETPGVRRLRLRDVDAVAALGVPGLLRSFETLKDLLMVGGASGFVEDGRVVAAAFTVDQSVNYARMFAFTVEDRRREGMASAAARHLAASHHEQGRLACALVPAGDPAAQALARAIGFDSGARVSRYRLV